MYYVRHLLTLLLFVFVTVGCSQEKVDNSCMETEPIVGQINQHTFLVVHKSVQRCLDKEKETRLTISGPGGNFGYTVGIFDTLVSSVGYKKLTTIAQGAVSSAGVLIFLTGYERHISCNATLFIHHPIMSKGMNRMEMEELTSLNNNFRLSKDMQMRLYHKVTKLSLEKIEKMLDDKLTLTADEAIKLGFATHKVGYCMR